MNRMPPPPRVKPSAGIRQQSSLLKQALTQSVPVSASIISEEAHTGFCEPNESIIEHDIATPSWEQYWTSRQLVEVSGRGAFNVYTTGQNGPLLLCLHGAGYTGLTWSLLASHLKDDYRVAAPDLRNHGLTTSRSVEELSKEVLVQDVVQLLKVLVASAPFCGSTNGPLPVVLVGHSMGGGLAVWVAAAVEEVANAEKLPLQLAGIMVIDVVEGTAIAALPHMMSVLNSRPSTFPSLGAAVRWARKTGVSKLDEAAVISLPSQLKQDQAGRWSWCTDLHATQPHWEGWYRGLSDQFLALRCPKMLVLAGTDRLDRTLTIGQMQGKFQLVLLPTAGHAVQEDQHEATAQKLLDFLKRFRVGQPIVPFPRAAKGVPPVLPIVAGPGV